MKGLGRRFGADWVLSHLNLEIRFGESVALFGNNGSGKSTFLKIVSTLLAPTTGQLHIFGIDGRSSKVEVRRRLCLLAHEKQLYDALTVMENMQIAADLRGRNLSKVEIRFFLDRLKIGARHDNRVSELSEGMKKRLVLARLLLADPDLILLDEPYPALDSEGREILNDLMGEWKRSGKTIIVASHDHEETLPQVGRVIVLHEGSVHYDGQPAKCRAA